MKPLAAVLSIIPAYISFRFIEQRFRSEVAIRKNQTAAISAFVIVPLFLSLVVVSGGANFIKTGLLPKFERIVRKKFCVK